MKRYIMMIGLLIAALSCMGMEDCEGGCGKSKSERVDREQVDRQQLVYQKAQPVPFLDYSLERDAVIQLYQARNSTVATHTVWRGDTSIIEDDCPSIGYPIPYDTSLTNPLQAYGTGSGRTTIEQPEPNGLYSSKNSIATWVRCVTKDGIVPIPVESKVTTYPYPVRVDYATNRVYKAGKATLLIKVKNR